MLNPMLDNLWCDLYGSHDHSHNILSVICLVSAVGTGIGSVDVVLSDPLTAIFVIYSDQASWTLGDVYVGIQCVCQIQVKFAECVISHNACRQ